MINKAINEFMSKSPSSLQEFSNFINKLIKEHGREQILNATGIDKNVLYRASNKQNITLENYYKIKQAYSEQLVGMNNTEITNLPILGQIINNDKVRTLNPSQPQSVPVPTMFISYWTPVFGYLCTSGTAYSGFVYIFSGKGIRDTQKINHSCVNRLIMCFPKDEDPLYGLVVLHENHYDLLHPRTREPLKRIPFVNDISWVKFCCLIPFSLMENYKEPNYQKNIDTLEQAFNETENPIYHD